jgi:hypothetical protein
LACGRTTKPNLLHLLTEKAVAALEQQWLQSQETNNPDLIAPLLADKFIGTGADGKLTYRA